MPFVGSKPIRYWKVATLRTIWRRAYSLVAPKFTATMVVTNTTSAIECVRPSSCFELDHRVHHSSGGIWYGPIAIGLYTWSVFSYFFGRTTKFRRNLGFENKTVAMFSNAKARHLHAWLNWPISCKITLLFRIKFSRHVTDLIGKNLLSPCNPPSTHPNLVAVVLERIIQHFERKW